MIRVQQAGFVYFDFLEAAVLSDVPDALAPRTNISPALDFDTDQTYKLSPSRLLWMMQQAWLCRPHQRIPRGVLVESATSQFRYRLVVHRRRLPSPDRSPAAISIVLDFNPPGGAQLGKSVFPTDTPATIAATSPLTSTARSPARGHRP